MDGDFTSNGFMKRTGAGSYTVDTNTYLTSIPSSYLQNLSEDTTPQLGGNLDVQSSEINTSTTNTSVFRGFLDVQQLQTDMLPFY